MNRNYQKELEKLLQKIEEEKKVPTLLLHSCCAPCSSYVIEYLSEYFALTVYYYNPNIYPDEEKDGANSDLTIIGTDTLINGVEHNGGAPAQGEAESEPEQGGENLPEE